MGFRFSKVSNRSLKKKNELIDCSFEKRPFTDVLENKYSQKFRNIHREAPVLESLFNKVAGWKASNLFYDTGLSLHPM